MIIGLKSAIEFIKEKCDTHTRLAIFIASLVILFSWFFLHKYLITPPTWIVGIGTIGLFSGCLLFASLSRNFFFKLTESVLKKKLIKRYEAFSDEEKRYLNLIEKNRGGIEVRVGDSMNLNLCKMLTRSGFLQFKGDIEYDEPHAKFLWGYSVSYQVERYVYSDAWHEIILENPNLLN